MWAGTKSSCLPPDVMSHDHVSRRNALRRITLCFRFLYNKELIAQLVGRHEDLLNPENTHLPQASPSDNMNFLGRTNLQVSRLTGQ